MNWKKVRDFEDILYEKCDGVAKVTINRPHRRNAFTPDTVAEMIEAFSDAKDDTSIGVVLLTGFNPQTDGKFAFARVGIRRSEVTKRVATWVKTGSRGSTFWICRS